METWALEIYVTSSELGKDLGIQLLLLASRSSVRVAETGDFTVTTAWFSREWEVNPLPSYFCDTGSLIFLVKLLLVPVNRAFKTQNVQRKSSATWQV